MIPNPFSVTMRLDGPLDATLCQEMHYGAMRKVERELPGDDVPASLSIQCYRSAAGCNGPTAYLKHPADVNRVFAGATLGVYQAIERLYCSRSGRTIGMVWRILTAMADKAHVPPIDYEAVWAICRHLDEKQAVAVEAVIDRTDTTWRLAVIMPRFKLQGRDGRVHQPALACVLDGVEGRERTIGIAVVEDSARDEGIARALYDAIVSQRRPAAYVNGGLCWPLPAHLVVSMDGHQLGAEARSTLAALRIDLALGNTDSSSLLDALRGDWPRDLENRILPRRKALTLLDTYLQRRYGYGPGHAQRHAAHAYRDLVGYNRDPSWQLPALRRLLPRRTGVIEGEVVRCDGLGYAHDLLGYWSGRQITLRLSHYTDAVAWIYLDEQVLCRAEARELLRPDGGYRVRRAREMRECISWP